jgi:hypothetical protein
MSVVTSTRRTIARYREDVHPVTAVFAAAVAAAEVLGVGPSAAERAEFEALLASHTHGDALLHRGDVCLYLRFRDVRVGSETFVRSFSEVIVETERDRVLVTHNIVVLHCDAPEPVLAAIDAVIALRPGEGTAVRYER